MTRRSVVALVVAAVVLIAGALLVRDRDPDEPAPVPASGRIAQTGQTARTARTARTAQTAQTGRIAQTAQIARIVSPAMGASEPREVEFSGTVTGLQPGETLWIVVQRPSGGRYYPAVGPCSVDGDERTCPKLDFDESGIFNAFPLLANEEGTPPMAALVPATASWSALAPVDRLPRGTWQWGPEVPFSAR